MGKIISYRKVMDELRKEQATELARINNIRVEDVPSDWIGIRIEKFMDRTGVTKEVNRIIEEIKECEDKSRRRALMIKKNKLYDSAEVFYKKRAVK